MTDEVIGRMDDPEHIRILEFVRHTLAAARSHEDEADGGRRQTVDVSIDIERLFAAVDLLVDRHSQPWSPFIATWHPGLEAFSPAPSVRQFDISFELRRFADEVKRLAPSRTTGYGNPFSSHEISNALGSVIEKAFSRAHATDISSKLSAIRREMLRSLFDLLDIDDASRVDYLRPLVALTRDQSSVTIATLNYDRGIENAADREEIPCDTLIEAWLSRGHLEMPMSGLQLLKLHGSINWVIEQERPQLGALPQQRIRVVAPDEKARYEGPAIIFGEGGKLRAEGPYLELLLAWSAELTRAESLLVVGYSFRDTHVNELIARWFNAEVSRQIVVVDPGSLDANFQSFGWHLNQIAHRPPNTEAAMRFHHIVAGAKAGLEEGIALARNGIPQP
jgi:hypothetical protein